MRFIVYGRFKNKTVLALLRLKVYNILTGLGWVMTYDIKGTPHVLLSNGMANFGEDVKFLRGVCNTIVESHIKTLSP